MNYKYSVGINCGNYTKIIMFFLITSDFVDNLYKVCPCWYPVEVRRGCAPELLFK